MTTHFGKRNGGALTAASPGDTLYIPLNFYNDSGASISIGSSLAVTDIEVFKDGGVTQRATDSGYALLGDTGNFDSRIGFKGISISLFNTADDSTFYAVGSTYWVAIDSVTVDGRTVRFWPAIFEIGEPRANIVQIRGDTGGADRFYRYTQKLDTGGDATVSASIDTGQVNQAVWQGNAARSITDVGDTGIVNSLQIIRSDVDTGLRTHISDVDTGLHDTIADLDTGLRGHISAVDTGLHDTLADYDTGVRGILITTGVNVGLIDGDTGAANQLRATYADGFNDTGVNARFDRIGAATGSALSIDAATDNTAGGISGVTSGTTFVGSQTGTFANTSADDLSYHVITHSANAIDIVYQFLLGGGVAPVLCVWIGYLTGNNDQFTISAWDHSGGAWESMATINGQSGTANIQHNCPLFGRFVGTSVAELGKVYIRLHCTGQTSPVLNTDQIYVSYAVTSTDTGVNDRLAKILADTDTGIQSSVNVTAFADTGVNDRLAKILADTDTGIQSGVTVTALADTGVNERLTAIETQTAKLTFDTGNEILADIRKVNSITVGGSGTSSDGWGPA